MLLLIHMLEISHSHHFTEEMRRFQKCQSQILKRPDEFFKKNELMKDFPTFIFRNGRRIVILELITDVFYGDQVINSEILIPMKIMNIDQLHV